MVKWLQCRRPEFDPWEGKIPWRRKRQPTPVLLLGKSHGWRSLVGYSSQGRKKSNTTEWLHFLSLSLVAQTVKYLPTMWETQDRSLGWEDPLEKGMATHSSFLAWKIPWTEEPGRLQFMGSQRVGHDWATSLTHSLTQHTVHLKFVPMDLIKYIWFTVFFLSF